VRSEQGAGVGSDDAGNRLDLVDDGSRHLVDVPAVDPHDDVVGPEYRIHRSDTRDGSGVLHDPRCRPFLTRYEHERRDQSPVLLVGPHTLRRGRIGDGVPAARKFAFSLGLVTTGEHAIAPSAHPIRADWKATTQRTDHPTGKETDVLASPALRIKKCLHTEISTYSVAGMTAQRCSDCGKVTLTFVEPACVGIWTPDTTTPASAG
jgi:hypothetical protein